MIKGIDPEPDLPADECTTADLLRKIANNFDSGYFTVVDPTSGGGPSHWSASLRDRAERLDRRVALNAPSTPASLVCPHCQLPAVMPEVCTPEVHTALEARRAADAEMFAGRQHGLDRPMSSYTPASPLQEVKQRDIPLLRSTLAMLCHYAWHKNLRPGEHLWSIPVDKERDFDCILSDAIDELEARRFAQGLPASSPQDRSNP
jgi:hypothetical protein